MQRCFEKFNEVRWQIREDNLGYRRGNNFIFSDGYSDFFFEFGSDNFRHLSQGREREVLSLDFRIVSPRRFHELSTGF